MSHSNPSFKDAVQQVVSVIPSGRLMTYGQIAAICGNPRAARIVGGIAHFGDPELPWHRVVNKNGGLASGFSGGKIGHKQILEQEGFVVRNYEVDVARFLWWPN